MTAFVPVQAVRDILALNADSTSRYSDATISSNIRAASEYMERATNRYFAARDDVTLTYTTNGAAIIDLPGVRSVSSVSLAGSVLVANESYWLLPDAQQTGIYTSIQLRGFTTTRGPWWKSVPQWFDRNLDSPYYPGNWEGGYGSLPGDLVIVADAGYAPDELPEALLLATKALAAFLTLRPQALLSGAFSTGGWIGIPMDELPVEVRLFVSEWRLGSHQVLTV